MKRIILIFSLIILGPASWSQPVTKGDFIFDPYVGLPTGDLWNNIWWGSGPNAVTYTGMPISVGGRAEIMLADNFGIGADVNYATLGYKQIRTVQEIIFDNETGDWVETTREELLEVGFTKFRAMMRLNYHFIQNETLDVYVGVGAGYRSMNRYRKIDGIDSEDFWDFNFNMPVAGRVGIGARYYFAENIGANFELGLGGGGVIQLGVSVRL